MHEKLLEGLTQHFEVMAPHRAQIETLHHASLRDPILGLHLLAQLSEVVDRLLRICGDDRPSLQRQIRVRAIVGLLLRVRPVWQKDTSLDLAPTMKQLDKNLRDAADWAASFGLVPKGAAAPEEDAE